MRFLGRPPGIRFTLVRLSITKLLSPANFILLIRLSQANNCQYHVKLLHQLRQLLQGKKCKFPVFSGEAFVLHQKVTEYHFLIGKAKTEEHQLHVLSVDLEDGSEIIPPPWPNTFNSRLAKLETSQVTASKIFEKKKNQAFNNSAC